MTLKEIAIIGIRSVIETRYKDGIFGVSREELLATAKEGREKAKSFYEFTDEEFETIFNEQIAVTIENEGAKITEPYKPWVQQENANIEWALWGRYEKYLSIIKMMPQDVIGSLNKSSREILDLLGNPRKETSFFRRGLVIGDVQSGKTSTYTAIAAKALDAGYKILIIMTSNNDRLRRQTQSRIDKELVGTDYDRNIIKGGVADPKKLPYSNNNSQIESFTSTEFDFSTPIMKAQKPLRDNTQAVFVVKKNKKVLENVCEWLEKGLNTGSKINYPTLILDDEADNASVNVSKQKNAQDKYNNPSGINKEIRNIMNHFERVSYVGVTATPFANIFIPPDEFILENLNPDELTNGVDLFPSDFIYLLPTPNNYIGSKAIFGSEADGENEIGNHHYMLEYIDSDNLEQVFPTKHTKKFAPIELPYDLYTAMRYFLLVNAVRDVNGDKNKHRSMIVHISRFNDVQEKVEIMIDSWLTKVVEDVKFYSTLPADEAEKRSVEIKALHEVFDKMKLQEKNKDHISWEKIFKKYLKDAIIPICVQVQNGKKKHPPIDYDNEPKGLRVIVVGGNVLSRGMTFEGLCVTYFNRNSKMYDTLMQMGRWFGYRNGYANLCKVWIPLEIARSFQFINRVVDDMKDQIYSMQYYHKTPKDFGLHILCDPESRLLITGRDKMKDITSMMIPQFFSQQVLQVSRIVNNAESIERNSETVLEFLKNLPNISENYPAELNHTPLFWQGVSSNIIADFVTGFETPKFNQFIARDAVIKYISDNMQDMQWDIAIPEGSGNLTNINISGNKITLKPLHIAVSTDSQNNDEILIGGRHVRVVYPEHGKLGLTKTQAHEIEEKYFALHCDKKTVPFTGYLTHKHNPILLIYIIEPKLSNDTDKAKIPETIYTIALGFPYVEGEQINKQYAMNYVDQKALWSQYTWDTDDDGDDEEDYDDED